MKRIAMALALTLAAAGCGTDGEETEHEHGIDTTGTDAILALTGDSANGESLYPTCAACHGSDGSGGIGPSLIEEVPELSDAEIAGAIKNGVGDEMPPQSFEDQEIADILAYLRATFGE